jgi:hypothetical protein
MRRLYNVRNCAFFEPPLLGCEHLESPLRAELPTALLSQALLMLTRGQWLLWLSFINILCAERVAWRARLVLRSELDRT